MMKNLPEVKAGDIDGAIHEIGNYKRTGLMWSHEMLNAITNHCFRSALLIVIIFVH